MSFYVNMNDKFLSGWGGAARGRSLYCIKCETYSQALAIQKAADARSEMVRVAISDNPRRARAGDHLRVVAVHELGGPWLHYMGDSDLKKILGAQEHA